MNHFTHRNFSFRLLTALLLGVCYGTVQSAPLALSNTPLFVTITTKPNILLMFSNANNMDEDPTGLAVGSDAAASKSEIARIAARSLVSTYTGKINMGLMAYQQSGVVPQWLNQSPYDASYDPLNYSAAFSGARTSTTKAFRVPNPTSAGDYVYYNVNLPYYSPGPGGSLFCYSSNSKFTISGPNDYACYSVKTGTSDAAPSIAGSGYSSYSFSSTFGPTDSDLAQNILFFGTRLVSFDVGPTWFANTSPGLGYLHVPVANLDSTQAAALNLKLATSVVPTYSAGSYNSNPTSISGGNTATNPNAPMQNAGLSPITGTFMTAKDYFNGATGSFGSSQGGAKAAPPDACNKDFVVFLTNGLPNVDSSGVAATYTGTVPYSPSEVANSVTAVADLNSGSRPVGTYVIGFALPTFTSNYFTPPGPTNPLDQMAAKGVTTAMTKAGAGTSAYYASSLASLNATFDKIFKNILAQSGSGAAVALNSGSVGAGSKEFQGQFNPVDWTGDLVAYNIDEITGDTIMTPTAWNAALKLNGLTYTGRKIITYKASNSLGARGIPFRWPVNPLTPTSTELDTTQISALNTTPTGTTDTNGQRRLNYIRGDATYETCTPVLPATTCTPQFRPRPATKLGDIVDSAPFYVDVPDSNYSDTLESAPYSTFRNLYKSRAAMVYVGANDGMLHGFDATTIKTTSPTGVTTYTDGPNAGNEVLAYVPSLVYPNLTQLTSTSYSHRYFVNGSPTVLDGFYGGAWHTVLVSGLAGGGQGFFALDVTDPSIFTEANADKLGRWEFTDSNDADLGFSFSQPSIVKLNNGIWAAIFGNGYNNTAADGKVSTTGNAVLYIVNLETGALIKKIDTKYGSTTTPNGLATPTAVDTDGNDTADTVYAGDLAGNLWKFDISASNPTSWGSAFMSGSTPNPLFVAQDGASPSNRQPITAAPDIIMHPLGSAYGYMVVFGTGKYLETGDPATTSSQTFYGIQDKGVVVAGRTTLVQQTVTSTVVVKSKTYRTLSNNAVSWTGGSAKKGWYLDLPISGERAISESTTDNGRVLFTTVVPSPNPCSAGGTGLLMELDLATGGALSLPTFDVNGDGVIDSKDDVGSPGVYPGGVQIDDGIPSAVRLQKKKPFLLKRLSLSNKTIATVKNKLAPTVGRTSWREIIQ